MNEIHISHSTQKDSLILCPIYSFDIDHYPVDRLSKARLIIFQDCAFNKPHSTSVLRVAFQGNMRVWNTYVKKKIIICIVIGHLRGTVKTSHKARLQWNYG